MSARRQPEPDSLLLRRRVGYFFDSRARARSEVSDFAKALGNLGPVVVIGGFLRDLSLSGNRHFKSDVDFVVDPASIPEFEKLVQHFAGTMNRFGGYGIKLNKWKVDVWPLERTWAAVSGHVSISHLDDLIYTTFFNWDAVLYLVQERIIRSPSSYFANLRHRILDINLEPNPNPLGNAVRALRYAYRWEAALSGRLVSFVTRQIRDHGWETLVASERNSFPGSILRLLDGDIVFSTLRSHDGPGNRPVHLPLRPAQKEIEFWVDGIRRQQ